MTSRRPQLNYLSVYPLKRAGRRRLPALFASLLFSASRIARHKRWVLYPSIPISSFISIALIVLLAAQTASDAMATTKSGFFNARIPSSISTQASAGCDTPSFSPATNFGVGEFPQQVAVGDFNGDGKLDLVTANESTLDVSVLLGDGKGGFSNKTEFPAGIFPFTVTVGDFNLDHKQDLVVVTDFDEVAVLLGDGTGSFGKPTNFRAENNVDQDGFPVGGTIGDFNLDGKPDMVVALVRDKVSVLLGDGNGGFGKPTTFGVGLFPRSPIVEDFNLDGKPDVATANLGDSSVSVLLGDGKGGFGNKTDFPVGEQTNSVAAGDFNGDGKPDLATANNGPVTPQPGVISGNVSVLLGDGKGSFGSRTDFPAGNGPISVTTGDFNLDAKLDLAIANVVSNDVSVLLGDGAGSFNSPLSFAVANLPDSVTVADFDGDGRPDIATADANPGQVSVLLDSSSDLAITMSDSPDPVVTGNNVTYSITVTNKGAAAASDVSVTDTLSAGANFVSAVSSQGSCIESAGTVTCNIGALAKDANANITILVTATTAGTITNTASVISGVCDPNADNNTVTQETTVNSPNKCPLPVGFWKNNPSTWAVNTLSLGNQSYIQAELLTLLNTAPRGDASVIVSRQLIAAKLNLANGSNPVPVSITIADADRLLASFSGKLPYNVATSSLIGQSMTSDANVLETYNNGILTQGCVP